MASLASTGQAGMALLPVTRVFPGRGVPMIPLASRGKAEVALGAPAAMLVSGGVPVGEGLALVAETGQGAVLGLGEVGRSPTT